jgi:hypothetical protein
MAQNVNRGERPEYQAISLTELERRFDEGQRAGQVCLDQL